MMTKRKLRRRQRMMDRAYPGLIDHALKCPEPRCREYVAHYFAVDRIAFIDGAIVVRKH